MSDFETISPLDLESMESEQTNVIVGFDETTGEARGQLVDGKRLGNYNFYQYDGDFNGNQTGQTSQTTDDYGLFDMVKCDDFSGATLEKGSHAGDNTKENYATFKYDSSDSQNINFIMPGNPISGKNISVCMKIRKNSSINNAGDIVMGVLSDTGALATPSVKDSFLDLTTDWEWRRYDFDCSAVTDPEYNAFQVLYADTVTSEKGFDIDKIRITDRLPGNEGKESESGVVIPDRVKADENKEAMLDKVLQYFETKDTSHTNGSFGSGFCLNTSTAYINLEYFPKSAYPTISINGDFLIKGGNTNANDISLASSNRTGKSSAQLPFQSSGSSFTDNEAVCLWADSDTSAYIEIDCRP